MKWQRQLRFCDPRPPCGCIYNLWGGGGDCWLICRTQGIPCLSKHPHPLHPLVAGRSFQLCEHRVDFRHAFTISFRHVAMCKLWILGQTFCWSDKRLCYTLHHYTYAIYLSPYIYDRLNFMECILRKLSEFQPGRNCTEYDDTSRRRAISLSLVSE